jgi:hypothetical protein
MQTFQLMSDVDSQGILRVESQLPAYFANQKVEILLVVQEKNHQKMNKRPIGLLKGKFEVPASFFEPLPEDVLEAFEGKM